MTQIELEKSLHNDTIDMDTVADLEKMIERKKIEKLPDSPQYIQTHIGVGYRMMKVE